MNTIGNKMFAYIDNHSELTQSMVNQYNDSLIFLGDEKQIFVPVINAYVGIGQTAYNNLLARIGQNDDHLLEYNKYIHNDTVTSIYVQFSPEEIESIRTQNGQTPTNSITVRGVTITEKLQTETPFKANKNVVLKGFNDYNLLNGLDELGRPVNTSYTSGITVSIAHEGTVQTGNYTFVTQDGQTHTYTYTYYDPYDTITIDDTKTWSYIKSSNSYLTNFVTQFAVDQANRVYKNILGITDNNGKVFIEKEFDEAFNYSDVTKTVGLLGDVYIKSNDGTYQLVTVENQSNVGFAVIYNGNVIWTNIEPDDDNKISINNRTYTVLSGDSLLAVLDKNGDPDAQPAPVYYGYIEDYDDDNNLIIVPRWYHVDQSNSASSYINIADGIQTLKEVAYILDKISDGDDTGINLAYNISSNFIEIEKLKKWASYIGNETVSSFQSESGTDLLTVNYYSTNLWDKDRDNDGASIGKVKLDIDLKLAQTYTLNGVTYVAYLQNHPGVTNTTYFIYKGDRTNVENYIQLTGSNNAEVKELLQSQNPSISTIEIKHFLYEDPDDNTKVTGVETESTISIDNIGSISGSNKYIYFPYEKCYYDFTKGLTDVKWVTTYVSYVNTYLNDRINNLNVSSQIETIINELDATTYAKVPGQFVTHVTEEDGIIHVYQETLPLDTILSNNVFYTNDIYLHIPTSLATTSPYSSALYQLNSSGEYSPVDSSNYHDLTLYDNLYYKTNLANMNMVPHDTSVGEMIANGANVSYFYKRTTKNYTEYLPLDIQKENTSGTLLSSDKVVADNTIYYWPGTNTNNQIKYFDLSTIQRNDGSTTTIFTSYITYLAASSSTNSGLADSWDVRRTIESMFQWVNIKTNKIIG